MQIAWETTIKWTNNPSISSKSPIKIQQVSYMSLVIEFLFEFTLWQLNMDLENHQFKQGIIYTWAIFHSYIELPDVTGGYHIL